MVRLIGLPIMACRAAGDSVPPARSASSVSAMSHTFSLSTSVPSMSNSTAAGSRAFRAGLRSEMTTAPPFSPARPASTGGCDAGGTRVQDRLQGSRDSW
jgi:hypothetical protein